MKMIDSNMNVIKGDLKMSPGSMAAVILSKGE
jgi:hypothetical protein